MKDFLKALAPTALRNMRFAFKAPLAFEPGHFYSPICGKSDLRYYTDPKRSGSVSEIPGIDLNEDGQRELWQSWEGLLKEFPFPDTKGKFRYFCQNMAFGIGDAMVLYCVLRHFRPTYFIEIGSGFSSACALDTIDKHLSTECLFIEPNPAVFNEVIGRRHPRHCLFESEVQRVPLETYDRLERNDILFIDSTHVLKTGSDVTFELFEILPRLKSGVIVHFHDIFYPFEYLREWVIDRNYSWNEIYAVRAFLTGNRDFKILFFNDYFAKRQRGLAEQTAPRFLQNPGGGLWIQKA